MADIAPPLPVPLTVINAMTASGLNLDDATIFATQIFMDDFYNLQRYLERIYQGRTQYVSILTIAQGKIRLLPEIKQKIKAFTQWIKDQFWLGINPTTMDFPVDTTAEILRRVKTYKMFVARSNSIASAAKPDNATKDTKW